MAKTKQTEVRRTTARVYLDDLTWLRETYPQYRDDAERLKVLAEEKRKTAGAAGSTQK